MECHCLKYHIHSLYKEEKNITILKNGFNNSDFFTQNLGPNIGVFTILKMGKNTQKKNEENSQCQLPGIFYY